MNGLASIFLTRRPFQENYVKSRTPHIAFPDGGTMRTPRSSDQERPFSWAHPEATTDLQLGMLDYSSLYQTLNLQNQVDRCTMLVTHMNLQQDERRRIQAYGKMVHHTDLVGLLTRVEKMMFKKIFYLPCLCVHKKKSCLIFFVCTCITGQLFFYFKYGYCKRYTINIEMLVTRYTCLHEWYMNFIQCILAATCYDNRHEKPRAFNYHQAFTSSSTRLLSASCF